jgi:hypothetical protein
MGHLDEKVLAAGGKADGWTFLDKRGVLHRRVRNPAGNVPVYDVEWMDPEELEAFLALWERYGTRRFCHTLYPTRPLGYVAACKSLWELARLRFLKRKGWKDEFERRYATLPLYAQFRNYWNVRGAKLPGKKFRKKVPAKPLDKTL